MEIITGLDYEIIKEKIKKENDMTAMVECIVSKIINIAIENSVKYSRSST